jgi:hypothetical protein
MAASYTLQAASQMQNAKCLRQKVRGVVMAAFGTLRQLAEEGGMKNPAEAGSSWNHPL